MEELFEWLLKHKIHTPDIIFLEVNMPLMNGWECLKKLKDSSNFKNIPIVMYSTSSTKKDVEMAYSLGAMLFLKKPENFSELSKILEILATSSQDSLLSRLTEFESVKFN